MSPYWNGTSWVVNSTNIFNNGGNVGIGTSSPATKLDVSGIIATKGLIISDNSSNSLSLTVENNNTNSYVNVSSSNKEYFYYENENEIPVRDNNNFFVNFGAGVTSGRFGISTCTDGVDSIYVGFGGNDWTPKSTFWKYKPQNKLDASGGWTLLNSTANAVTGATTVFYNNTIYRLGGLTSSTSETTPDYTKGFTGIRVYDVTSDTWSSSSIGLQTVLSFTSAVVYSSGNTGFIFYAGGLTTSSSVSNTYLYRITINADGTLSNQTRLLNLDILNLSTNSQYYCYMNCLEIMNGRLYIAGDVESPMISIDLNELSNLGANKTLSDLPSARTHAIRPSPELYIGWLMVNHKNKLYIMNGRLITNNAVSEYIYRYNETFDRWDYVGKQFKHMFNQKSIISLNDQVYIFGGYPGVTNYNNSTSSTIISKFYVNNIGEGDEINSKPGIKTDALYITKPDQTNYKISTSATNGYLTIEDENDEYYRCQAVSTLPIATQRQPLVVSDGTTLYYMHWASGSGNTSALLPGSTSYKFTTPESQPNTSWKTFTSDPSGNRLGVAGVYYNGKIYTFGGTTSYTTVNTRNFTRIYDITSDSWSSGQSVPNITLNGTSYNITNGHAYSKAVLDTSEPSTPYIWLYVTWSNTAWLSTGRIYRYNINANSWELLFVNLPIPSTSGAAPNTELVNCFVNYKSSLWLVGVTTGASYTKTNYTLKLPYVRGTTFERRSDERDAGMDNYRFTTIVHKNKMYQLLYSNDGLDVSQRVFEYDENTDSWFNNVDMELSFTEYSGTVVSHNNSIYIFGGLSELSLTTASANIYRLDIRKGINPSTTYLSINKKGLITNSRIGVGIETPNCPLHITSMVLLSIPGVVRASGVTSNATWTNNGTTTATNQNMSIYVNGNIATNNIFVFSDQRIKKDIEIIDDFVALTKLRSIEPKLYHYIDNLFRGPNKVLGFIAQQIYEHIPECIQIYKNFIPNIYQFKNYIKLSDTIIQINNDINLIINNKIKILDDLGEVIATVTNIDSEKITLELNRKFIFTEEYPHIFIYGTEVDDFQHLNKDYLFTINFSATQELDRMIDWHTKEVDRSVCGDATTVYGQSLLTQIKTLQIQNQDLQTENTSLQSRVTSLETQLQSILTRLTNANI